MATDKGSGGVGALYLADLGYPMLRGDERENFDELQDYLFRLVEALRWTLGNLDETNFNQNFFLDFAVGELYKPLPVEFEVSVYRVGNYPVDAGIIGTLYGSVHTILTADGFSAAVHAHWSGTATLESVYSHVGSAMETDGVTFATEAHDGPV